MKFGNVKENFWKVRTNWFLVKKYLKCYLLLKYVRLQARALLYKLQCRLVTNWGHGLNYLGSLCQKHYFCLRQVFDFYYSIFMKTCKLYKPAKLSSLVTSSVSSKLVIWFSKPHWFSKHSEEPFWTRWISERLFKSLIEVLLS